MEKLLLLLSFAFLASAQNQYIECTFPRPGYDCAAAAAACVGVDTRCEMMPNNQAGYEVTSGPEATARGFKYTLDKIDPEVSLFEDDIQTLTFEVIYHEEYHLQVKIYDPNNARYEIPYQVNLPTTPAASRLYTVSVSQVGTPFDFSVTRDATGTTVWESIGPLTYGDQFIEISTKLPSEFFYGIGENSHTKFKRSFATRETDPIFTRDQPPADNDYNLYGAQPYYVNIEDEAGNTHSVLFYNSNAMEYSTFTYVDGVPALTMRTIGGIVDLHFFFGPSPEDVNIQYANAIGLPTFPPYYALGFHLSRNGYNSTDHVREVRDRMKAAGIPHDVQTFDIDYMDNERDFTIDPINWGDLPQLVDELHADGLKVTIILDPAVVIDTDNYEPYNRGRAQDVFIKWMDESLVPTDQPLYADDYVVGYVWPDNKTVFPDYMYPPAITWWTDECQRFYQLVEYDCLWIDMNEPANFGTNLDRPFNYPPELPDWSLKCPYTKFDDPLFHPKASYHSANDCQRISDKTICMSSIERDGTNTYNHYDTHNLYGLSELKATEAAMEALFPAKKHLIYSRSTFPGAGKSVTHWLGDNTSNFDQLKWSIIGLLEFNLFAITNVGADVCGFFNDATDELCARWMELGAFYPFNRNHNTKGPIDQDPAAPGFPNTAAISRDVLLLRYKYNPYLYTLFYESNTNGNSIVRPLWNVHQTDLTARDVDDQFYWGTGLMVAPVVVEGAVDRDIYFPEGRYYDLVTGTLTSSASGQQNIPAPLEKIPVYVTGGTILPFQEPDVTTVLSRQKPFGFTVALDDSSAAAGFVYYDDGETANPPLTEQFTANLSFATNTFLMEVLTGSSAVAISGLNVGTIAVYGYPANPTSIEVNGSTAGVTWGYDDVTGALNITLTNASLGSDLTVVLS